MNTISEIEQLEELELKGEIQGYKVISGMKEPLYRKHHLPTPNTGSFSGEYGNSFFYPVSIAAREKLKEYNKDCVMYSNGYPDFLPFTTQTTPWGIIQFSEEIGHMTESRVSRKVDGINVRNLQFMNVQMEKQYNLFLQQFMMHVVIVEVFRNRNIEVQWGIFVWMIKQIKVENFHDKK